MDLRFFLVKVDGLFLIKLEIVDILRFVALLIIDLENPNLDKFIAHCFLPGNVILLSIYLIK